jgi:hypothetical protein
LSVIADKVKDIFTGCDYEVLVQGNLNKTMQKSMFNNGIMKKPADG